MGEEAYNVEDLMPTQAPTKAPGVVEVVERAQSNATTDVEGDRSSIDPPPSERNGPNPFSRVHTGLEMDDYFVRLKLDVYCTIELIIV
jgi:hypothetical protein